jgi:hypothetical protein
MSEELRVPNQKHDIALPLIIGLLFGFTEGNVP